MKTKKKNLEKSEYGVLGPCTRTDSLEYLRGTSMSYEAKRK